MHAPSPPDDHYVWLGRVMHACSMLEVQIGMIGWAAANGRPWTEDWRQVAGSPGAAWKMCRDALPRLSETLATEVSDLMAQADPIRSERNKYAHAVFTLDPTRPSSDQWVLKSARDPEFKPLHPEQGAHVVATANRLSKRVSALRQKVARHVAL